MEPYELRAAIQAVADGCDVRISDQEARLLVGVVDTLATGTAVGLLASMIDAYGDEFMLELNVLAMDMAECPSACRTSVLRGEPSLLRPREHFDAGCRGDVRRRTDGKFVGLCPFSSIQESLAAIPRKPRRRRIRRNRARLLSGPRSG